jgi:hypothetical protein
MGYQDEIIPAITRIKIIVPCAIEKLNRIDRFFKISDNFNQHFKTTFQDNFSQFHDITKVTEKSIV